MADGAGQDDTSDYDVFISHASGDHDVAMELVDILESTGLRCWIAPRDIPTGSDYPSEIIKGIKACPSFVMLLSESSNASVHVLTEVERAKNFGMSLYWVRLADIEISDGLDFLLSTTQAMDSFGPLRYGDFHRLADTINWTPQPTRGQSDAEKSVVRAAATKVAESFRSWTVRLLRVAAYSALGWGLLSLNPIGFSNATESASQRSMFEIFAPFYGEPDIPLIFAPTFDLEAPPDQRPPPVDKWQDDITVVLVDDTALDKHDLTWPVSFDVHRRVLEDIYETYRPSVMMIDFFFMDRRPGEAEALLRFRDLLRRIRDEGITSVYIGAFNEAAGDARILEELRDVANLTAIYWHPPGGAGEAPLYYPMARGAGDRDVGAMSGDFGDPGPAFTIYDDLCANASESGRSAMHCPDPDTFRRHFEQPMKLFWGVRGPELNWEQSNRGERFNCRSVSGSVLTRTLSYMAAGIADVSPEFPQDCPYTQMVLARDILDAEFRAYPDVIEAYAAGLGGGTPDHPKVIFYGADLSGVQDQIETYTHGRVAGVYAHAMALDNLMTHGADYIRFAGHSSTRASIEIGLAMVVAIVSIIFTDLRLILMTRITARHRRLAALMRSSFGGLILTFGNLAVVLPLVLIVSAFSFVVLHLAPINWVGFLILAAMIRVIESRAVEKMALSMLSSTVDR